MKKLSINDLQEGMISNSTICDAKGIILIAKGVKLTKSNIQRLKKFQVETIDVQADEEPPLKASLSTPVALRAISAIQLLVEDLTEQKTILIKKSYSKIEQIIYSILEKPFVQGFLDIDAQDDYLYHHSLRTTVLSLNMGLVKGYNHLNLEYLAMSALMHDCGMGRDFHEDDAEHPLKGFLKMRENPDLDMVIALVGLQHHEHYDGSGYPLSARGTQISEFSRLIAVVDHYDRLIMNNLSPRLALFKTIEGKRTLFDPKKVELLGETINWSYALTR